MHTVDSSSVPLAKAGSHAFTEKSFKRRRVCDVCRQDIDNPGAFCKECKVAVHRTCEAKVTPTCTSTLDLKGSTKSTSQKKRGSIPRSKSVEQVMEHVMERHYDFDLTYITERLISVFFLPDLEEERYRRHLQEVASMLKSKHQDKFLLLNLSEKRHDINRLNQKVQDYGWPDLHAPPLDRICAICKAMETWLTSDLSNVVVLHCKGNKGKTGVIVAAYMHYSKISAGADQALTTLAMRKFCEDKVSSSLQPSQNRYVYYFSGLLSGTIKMNSSPLFLHQILIPSLPNFQTGGGFYPFLKIYQSLQLVYTSGVYDPQSSRARKLCVTVEPALLLKGDIMVKCYHRRSRAAEREVVFRVQFHTCTVHGAQLWFGKTELDLACADDGFPPDATVEFIFSNGPEKMKGREYRKNDASIKVDYDTSDHVVRWDSYENFNLHHQDSFENISHTRGPLDGSLYAQVRKRRGPGSTASAASPNGCLTSSPTVKPLSPTYSNSSCPSPPTGHLQDASASTNCPERENTDCAPRGGDGEDRAREKTRGKEKDRETAILDDGELFSPGGLRREHSCCGRASTKCANAGWERERAPCLSNGRCLGRCNSIKNHPKSQTLPALPSKSVSSPPNVAHMELCHRHSANPLPELPWEHPPPPLPPPLPCLHRPYHPYSTPEHAHPHSHSLPASNRLCSAEECHFFHYSNHSPSTHLPHQSLPSSPYREMFFGSPTPSSGCPCRECSSRREHQSDSVRTFHPLHPDQTENPHWSQGAGVQQREAPPLWESENPWEVVRDAEFWQCKSATPAFRVCHSSLDQVPNLEQPRFAIAPHQSYHSPQSLLDVRDGASSGYHTPPPPRHSCPCSPHQSSPAESHESRGYASGYHSGSASPLPASSPSTGRGRLPETPSKSREQQNAEVEKAKTDVEDDISQGSEVKSDSGGQSITPGLDSDHDYTIIGSSSPTHTEDSVTADSPTQSQETSTKQESSTNINKTSTTETQASSTSINSTQPSSEQSLGSDGKSGAAKITGSAEGSYQSRATSYAAVIITPVQMQLNGADLPSDTLSNCSRSGTVNPSASLSSSPSDTSPNSPIGSPELRPSPQCSPLATDTAGHRLTPDRDSSADNKPPSPVPDGYSTPTFPLASYYYPLLNVPHVPYTGYTAVTIPALQPPLPEKKRLSATAGYLNGHNSLLRVSSAPSPTHHVTFSPAVGQQRRGSALCSQKDEADIRVNAKFVQDSSKYWYKPGISRDQAIAVLKDREPGTFLIRDSNSFQGAYGLALKVATPPPNANITGSKGDPLEQLVRHFLIETGPRGVKIKGCHNESYFGSLSALVYQHSITPISLPYALRIPENDVVGELQEMQSSTSTSTAADLLKQGAACNVLYLNSVETESLTGPEAVSKATKCTLALSPRPVATAVHFKVSSQGITLTDSKRRLFFRRHYPINSVTYSSLDPQDKRWTNSDSTSCKMFGFVARRTGSATENVCHLFAEMDPEQPAVAIVNFINKVMLGPQLRR
ncbi:putative tensin-like C1 domain-containing phosphatase [Scophthalmus maximus]|uniref:Putative tensin-like C1 domain-containing phosphatase n=1 Tax=Scophthalmus maximus TaxID=52904 RepID=A0A2U9BGM1_SCOMX|nr:putative tensin-like C1 domain-containing phosphatase [Scophthalmus maximus]